MASRTFVAWSHFVLYALTVLIQRRRAFVYILQFRKASAALSPISMTSPGSGAALVRRDRLRQKVLYDVLLAFAAARNWPDVRSNALEPGWVATRMGGPSAPDDMDQAHRTQAWLAAQRRSGRARDGRIFLPPSAARSERTGPATQSFREGTVAACERISLIRWPA